MHVSKIVKISIGYKTQQNFTDQYQNDKVVFVRDRGIAVIETVEH